MHDSASAPPVTHTIAEDSRLIIEVDEVHHNSAPRFVPL
jgi:hypothetical protein